MNLKALSTLAMGTVLLVGCQEDNLGVKQQEVFTTAYDRNFTNTFGEVNPGQSWDFTRGTTDEFESIATVTDANYPGETFFQVPNALTAWMQANLVDGTDNSFMTQPFAMVAQPDQIFEIVPIYLGNHNNDAWKLHMVVVNPDGSVKEDITLWDKAHSNGNRRAPHGIQTYNGGSGWGWFNNNGSTMSSNTTAVRAVPVLVDCAACGVTEENTSIYFYMQYNNQKRTSISNPPALAAIDFDLAANAGIDRPDYESMLIGFDATGNYEYNDVVWLITGWIPQVAHDEFEETVTVAKRYMCEDMTNTGDYDFNDIVVDMTQVSLYKYDVDPTTGVATLMDGYPYVSQHAELTYLCGVIPSQVLIGGEPLFNKVTNPTDERQTLAELQSGTVAGAKTWWENPSDMRGISSAISKGSKTPTDEADLGWDPETNNISIAVWTSKEAAASASPSEAWVATFPESGEVPFIIATRQNVSWLGEGATATAEWFNSLGGALISK